MSNVTILKSFSKLYSFIRDAQVSLELQGPMFALGMELWGEVLFGVSPEYLLQEFWAIWNQYHAWDPCSKNQDNGWNSAADSQTCEQCNKPAALLTQNEKTNPESDP